MAIKVTLTTTGRERMFPHATDWYAGEDKTLQVYQAIEHEAQYTVAEFADGAWESVEFDPIPVYQPAPESTTKEPVR